MIHSSESCPTLSQISRLKTSCMKLLNYIKIADLLVSKEPVGIFQSLTAKFDPSGRYAQTLMLLVLMLFVLIPLVRVLLVLMFLVMMGYVKVCFIEKSYEESPVSLMYDVRSPK